MKTPRKRKSDSIIFLPLGLLAIIAVIGLGVLLTRGEATRSSTETAKESRQVPKNPGAASSTESVRGPADPHPLGVLPEIVMQGTIEVRDAYAFATNLDNRELMQTLRCYCGCAAGSLKHDNLFMCYVEDLLPDDQVIYSFHASGCKTCLAEVWDATKWQAEGKSLQEINKQIDTNYGGSR